MVLHRRLDRSRPGSDRLNPVQPGGRLHQDRQGEGGRHEHAVPHACLPPEAAVSLRTVRLCCLPWALLREPVRALQLLSNQNTDWPPPSAHHNTLLNSCQ